MCGGGEAGEDGVGDRRGREDVRRGLAVGRERRLDRGWL